MLAVDTGNDPGSSVNIVRIVGEAASSSAGKGHG